MRCDSCSREIPDDAVLCPYCGQAVRREVPPPPPVPQPRKRTGTWIAIVALVTIAVVCFVCVLCAAFGTTTPSYKAASTAEAAARQTEAARPTNTAIPTRTPAAITFADIQESYDTLTDMQWKSYEEGLRGTRVHWIGEVTQVRGDRTVFLDFGTGLLSTCYLEGLSEEEAASLSKGDMIEFEATIRSVDRFLGLSVYLYDPVLISRR